MSPRGVSHMTVAIPLDGLRAFSNDGSDAPGILDAGHVEGRGEERAEEWVGSGPRGKSDLEVRFSLGHEIDALDPKITPKVGRGD